MVGLSASVNLPLHHKVQKFSSGTGSSGWSRKKGLKTVVVVVVFIGGSSMEFKREVDADDFSYAHNDQSTAGTSRASLCRISCVHSADVDIICLSCVSAIFFFSSPVLSGRRLDVYHTSTHGVP